MFPRYAHSFGTFELARGRLEEAVQLALVTHHLIRFTRECLSGRPTRLSMPIRAAARRRRRERG